MILLSLYTIGVLLTGGFKTEDLVTLFEPWTILLGLIPCFRSVRTPPDPTVKDIRRTRRQNRRLLRNFVLIAAALPSLCPSVQGFSSVHQSRAPRHAIMDTSKLRGSNLDALRYNVNMSQHLEPLDVPGCQSIPIMVDCGASACTSPDLADFEPGTIQDLPKPTHMQGIGGNVPINKCGILRYTAIDDDGNKIEIRCPGFYMPELNQRLFSPQVFLATGGKGAEFVLKEQILTLRTAHGQKLSIPLDPTSRLFYVHCFRDVQQQANALADSLHVTNDSNTNLSRAQKLLIRTHNALAHCGFSTVQHVASLGWLGTHATALAKVDIPVCSSCQYGKGHKRNPETKTEVPNPLTQGNINKNQLNPGDLVSMDHFVVKTAGRKFESRGRDAPDSMYKGGTFFVDAASARIKVKFQVGLSANETIRSKMEYEREALNYGVNVRSYRTDNGTFTAQSFIQEIEKQNQTISFSGAGAQHQNAVAERAIKTICEAARTMMLHCALRWPEAYDESLWPMAVRYAVDIYNELPRNGGAVSPEEIYAQTLGSHSRIVNARPWGCPGYTLEPSLRGDGAKLPKWKPKTRRGQFMGFSPVHASTVGLMRNLKTQTITPQFHVVYDPEFQTTHASDGKPPAEWSDLIVNHRYATPIDDDSDLELTDEWLSPEELAQRQRRKNNPSTAPASESQQEERIKPEAPPAPPVPPPAPKDLIDLTLPREGEFQSEPRIESNIKFEPPVAPPPDKDPLPSLQREPPDSSPTLRRSKRVKFKNDFRSRFDRAAFGHSATAEPKPFGSYQDLLARGLSAHTASTQYAAAYAPVDPIYLCFLLQDWENGFSEGTIPIDVFAFKAMRGSDPDMPTFSQAMASPQSDYWREAIRIELVDLEKRETWIELNIHNLPDDGNLVPGTWAFKVKRFPDGRFRKFKARFCVRGDKQIEGVDFFRTYAPVVQWITVRMMLIVSASLDLKTLQVDYSNAFAQAFLEENIYVRLPQGCTGKYGSDTVLHLQRSLYGLRQAAVCWFDKLSDGLTELGWSRPLGILEPCLFTKDGVVCLVYVDDCLFFGRDQDKIRALVKEIEDAGFDLTIEDDVYAFLGVEVQFNSTDGTVTLTQTGLINKIIQLVGLEDGNSKGTPADKDPLGPGLEDDPNHDANWAYASAIGCLSYLGNNTRPDIQYATHACARYTHRPKEVHTRAVKRIVRYLLGTRDKGIIFKPQSEITLDLYVDADFAGMWHCVADEQDSVRVKSRTGYVLLLAGCPLLWVSKLQTETATSTLEAEFIALSTAMRDLIPARQILSALGKSLRINVPEGANLKSTVFEDNNGALTLATIPKMTPRTKHIGVKYFWFRDKCGPNTGITIVKVDTKDQLADTFTKGLTLDQFTILRQKLMGWTAEAREGVSLDLAMSVSAFVKHWFTNRRYAPNTDESRDSHTDLRPPQASWCAGSPATVGYV